jgi:hypothetical protein
MTKSDRIRSFVVGTEATATPSHPCTSQTSPLSLPTPPAQYLAIYLALLNSQRYYEAHDVLEQLWLQNRASLFYKGLIQFAGAFVHLQKQLSRPLHPKDGRRLHPASRLFKLTLISLSSYGPRHQGLLIQQFTQECHRCVHLIERSGFTRNPWNPNHAPRFEFDPPSPLPRIPSPHPASP